MTQDLAFSAVRVLDAHGALVRIISQAALMARARDTGKTAPVAVKASEAFYPIVNTPARRQKGAATLAKRNRARTKSGVVAA